LGEISAAQFVRVAASAYSSHYWRQRESVLLTSESFTGLIFLQLVQ
jgi:hypothetical protein